MQYTIFDLEEMKTSTNKMNLKSHLLLFFASPYSYIISQILWKIFKKTIFKKSPKSVNCIEEFCKKYCKAIICVVLIYIITLIAKKILIL